MKKYFEYYSDKRINAPRKGKTADKTGITIDVQSMSLKSRIRYCTSEIHQFAQFRCNTEFRGLSPKMKCLQAKLASAFQSTYDTCVNHIRCFLVFLNSKLTVLTAIANFTHVSQTQTNFRTAFPESHKR